MLEKITKENLVEVTNRNNGTTGYTLSNGLHRNFNIGETKKISMDELNELNVTPGGEYLLRNYLIINDKAALDFLNMDPEPEYYYTEDKVRQLLLEGSVEQLEDCLNFAPRGVIDLVKSVAVKLEIPDVRKRDLITEKTGFNVGNAIYVNKVLEEEPVKENSKAPARKAAPLETKQEKPSKYNIVKEG